jgi:hypothetical protein
MTGGYAYRGCRISNLQGHYFWSDWCDGRINSFRIEAGVPRSMMDWTATVDPGSTLSFDMTSFGRDGEGELYAVDQSGSILKLIPPLSDFEVAGPGVFDVDLFSLDKVANWTWEDLQFNSSHPILYYSVYSGTPDGVFDCLDSTTTTDWVGDAAIPGPGEVIGYVVTATNSDDVETAAGAGRVLGLRCGAP